MLMLPCAVHAAETALLTAINITSTNLGILTYLSLSLLIQLYRLLHGLVTSQVSGFLQHEFYRFT